MLDPCTACPHNRNERLMQLDAELHPELYKQKAESMPLPEGAKPQAAAVMLLTGSPEQTKQAIAWLQGKLNAKAFFCEKHHQCKWQGFRLHQGLGWGEIPGEHDPWRIWHTRECGGRLVELFTRVDLEETT